MPERARTPQRRTTRSPRTHTRITTPGETHETRDQLLRKHVGLVYHVARRLGQVGAESTFDDRVSAGMLGLMRAADNFDPASGTTFSTYAAPCIRGAILDDLRANDHVSRSVRTKARTLKTANATLGQILGRTPTETEVARHLDIDLPTLWQWQMETNCATLRSLNEPVSDAGDHMHLVLGDLIVPEQGDSLEPEGLLQREQEAVQVSKAILQLNTQQRQVLSLYYYEELTYAQIGALLNVSESRISQVHTCAIRNLRTMLAGLRD